MSAILQAVLVAAFFLIGSPMPSPTENFRAKAPEIMTKLRADFDLTDVQAAAIAGNMAHESLGLTAFQEKSPTVKGSRGGFGWAQWTGPRRVAFEAYCARNRLDPRSDGANYGWLFVELTTTHKAAITALRKAETLRQAVRAFELAYEAAGVKAYTSRETWANRALAAYRAAAGPSPDGPDPALERIADIRRLQARLTELGLGRIVGRVDGALGPLTHEAVRAFQLCRGGLAADGIAGPLTRAALGLADK